MRVLVCGDRNWSDYPFLESTLDQIHSQTPIDMIIEGEARGADKMSRQWAESRDIPYLAFPANWATHGRAAGPIRNRLQFNEGKPDLVVGFHDDIASSKGTRDMINYARTHGSPTIVYSHRGVNV